MARVDGGCSGGKHLSKILKILGNWAIQPIYLDPVRAVVAWLARPLFKFISKTNLPLPPAAPTEGYRRKAQGYVNNARAVTSRDVLSLYLATVVPKPSMGASKNSK